MDKETLLIREFIQEEEIYSLLDELNVGIYLSYFNGRFIFANKDLLSMFGYTNEELKQMTLNDLIIEQDTQLVKEEIEKVTNGGTSTINQQICGKRKDNSIVFLKLLSFKKYKDIGIIGKVIDISDQMFGDANVNYVTNGSPLAHIVLDINGIVKGWNLAAEKMFGWKKDEVINRPYPLVTPEELNNFEDRFDIEKSAYTFTGMEVKRLKKDQTLIDCVIYSIPLYNKRKTLTGVIVIFEDISEQKKKEIQLSNTFKELEDFKFALDQASTVSITDHMGDILYVNDKFCEISKYSREELIGRNHRIVKSGFHTYEFYLDMWSTIKSGETWKGEFCNKAKDGSIWWGSATIVPFLDKQRNPYQYVGIIEDITKKKKMEEEIQKRNEEIYLNERRFRSLVQHSYDIISVLDEKGIIKYVSPNFIKVSGIKEDDTVGKNAFHFVYKDDISELMTVFERVLDSPEMPIKTEVRLISEDGVLFNCEIVYTNLLHDPAVKGIALNIRDVTESIAAENKIYQMSYYDYLTSLPNRRLFESRMEQECSYAKNKNRKFSLVLLEIRGLKFVNDSLGTEIGDKLLQEAVLRLKPIVDNRGVFCRLEGNEFSIIYPKMHEQQEIKKNSEKILSLFKSPFIIDGYELFLSISMGISIYPDSGETVHSLIKGAYSAVSEAREKGLNHYQIFAPNMNIKSYKRFVLKNDLRNAVKNDEFFLNFQPRIDAATNKIIGAEALIRWDHPKWGVVSPGEFISLAEEGGLIGSLGEMVLLHACEQNKKWQEAGMTPIIVSVNFSVIQFLQTDTIQVVDQILKKTGLDPKWLEIEITESAVMRDEAIVIAKIEKLRAMGVNIAIDDFGTGYASLSYVKKLKASTLKIDRSFIKGIPSEVDSTEIVSSIIHLAKRLNIRTVAEGVETVEQLHALQNMNCDEIQGYLYSRPVNVQEFEALLLQEVCLPAHINNVFELKPKDRRKYPRMKLIYPLNAYMSVSEIGGQQVMLGSSKVLIQDIGLGGIQIETNINLPVRSDLVFNFSTLIFGEKLEISGTVAWNMEMDDDLQAYGICFIIDEQARTHLSHILNKLQTRLYQNPILTDCSFVTKGKKRHFQD